MKVLALGSLPASPSEISEFSGVHAYYLNREFAKQGVTLTWEPRPPIVDATKLRVHAFDHVIAFGLRYFEKLPAETIGSLKRRANGKLCEFSDGTIAAPKADLTFASKGPERPRNTVIGWAADPELCCSGQDKNVLRILIDHPDYVKGRGCRAEEIINDAKRFAKESDREVIINVLGTPKGTPSQELPFPAMCAEYSTAHVFLVTHPESVGLTVIETATAGALVVTPKGFIDANLLRTVRHVTYEDAIPWTFVMEKINPGASRAKAIEQTWEKVATRMVEALK